MAKRFKIIDEQFISYYGGTGHKISNEECGFWLWHSKIESQKVCDKLNNILDENEQLKSKNRGLQSELQIFKEDVTHSNQIINKLNDENEHLKKENKKLHDRICNEDK